MSISRHPGTGHYATDVHGLPYEAEGFSFTAHDAWAEAGHCPVVSRTKAWCGRAPHGSLGRTEAARHGSAIVRAPGREGWTWWES